MSKSILKLNAAVEDDRYGAIWIPSPRDVGFDGYKVKEINVEFLFKSQKDVEDAIRLLQLQKHCLPK